MEKQPDGNVRKLRYAIIELIAERGTASSIEKGLFKGIKTERGQTFMWIKTNSDITRACNLAYYNILSIESYDGDTRRFTFFQATVDEQKTAFGRVKDVFVSLKDFIDKESDLVKTSLYTDIPDNFSSYSQNNLPSGPQMTRHDDIPTGSSSIYAPAYDPKYTPRIKKDPEPFAFKRASKKPTKAALKKLNAKLDLIDLGEYEYTIPEVKEESDVIVP